MHRLPPNKKSSVKKKQYPSFRISYVNLEHTVSENIFSQKKNDILNITNEKVNFHVSLTKYRSDLLHETNTYVSKNANGKVKFCFADSHGDLKSKFSDNKNVSYDSLQSFLEALDKKFGNREIEQQFNHDREWEGDE